MNSGNCEQISSRLTFQACKMKKQVLSYFGLILVLSLAVSRLQAQSPNQASTTGHVFAEVIAAFSAVETSQMNFGRFSPGPYGGQLILTPQGTVSVMGSVVEGSGIHNAASFYVSGDSYTSFSISLPKSSATLTNTSDAKTMIVSNWVSVPSPGPGGGTLQDGFQTVYVGATLEVGTLNDNPVGIYTGSYTITFDFN
jgi:Domain of unknown function (DUF4402)